MHPQPPAAPRLLLEMLLRYASLLFLLPLLILLPMLILLLGLDDRLDPQPQLGPAGFTAHSLGPDQQAQRVAGLGRQLPAAQGVFVHPIDRRANGRHAPGAQRLVDDPALVGVVLRAHDEEPCQVDAQPLGSGGIKVAGPIHHHDRPALLGGLPRGDQRQRAGPGGCRGREPLDQGPPPQPSLRQQGIQPGLPRGDHAPALGPPGSLQLANPLGQIGHHGGDMLCGLGSCHC